MSSPCPSNHELRNYAHGRLDDLAATGVADHLDTCEACRRTVEDAERQADWRIDPLHCELPADPYLQEEQCLASIRRARLVPLERSPPRLSDQGESEKDTLENIREYKLLRRIGTGGMGTVYEAVHTKLGRTVAVKVLPDRRTQVPEAVARFQREMEAVGRLDHENIVRATDAGEFQGRHFLVMEYVEGYDLSRLAERLGPLPIADACEIIRQAAVGLDHVHEHALVHRDVKPSNLMLTRDGVVKVSDLGLALLEPRLTTVAEELTESGQLMGTIDYMAPEQAQSTRVDIRADVYGLGATLFKLLTGRAPLDAPHLDTPLKKVAALADFQTPSVAELRSDLPSDLVHLLDRMLAKDPAERPSALGEVARTLQPLTVGAQLNRLCAEAMDREDASNASDKAGLSGPESRIHLAASSAPLNPGQSADSHKPRSRQPALPWIFLAATTAIIASAAAWFVVTRGPSRDGQIDREVAELVLGIGGEIDIAYAGDSYPISDARHLPSEPFQVEWIMLTGNRNVRDEHLARCARLRHLKGITLQETQISDAGVQLLGQIPTLSHAYLNATAVTDDGVQPITELDLVELTLNDTEITNTTLTRLAGQANLARLHVSGTRINNDGVRHIARMSSLRFLDLRETEITDEALAGLSSLAKLERLEVSDTRISDDGLHYLLGLSQLRRLEAIRTRVTTEGAAQLEAALRDCRVVLQDPED